MFFSQPQESGYLVLAKRMKLVGGLYPRFLRAEV